MSLIIAKRTKKIRKRIRKRIRRRIRRRIKAEVKAHLHLHLRVLPTQKGRGRRKAGLVSQRHRRLQMLGRVMLFIATWKPANHL